MTTEQMDSNDAHPLPRKCFAYNQQGQRCTLHAGHDSMHVIAISWTDDECLDPAELLDATTRFMPVPEQPTPPFAGTSADAIMEQVARAEAAWARRNESVDQEALAAMDFGHPAPEPVLVDNRCVACDHQHASGKCRCGCETFIPRLS
jgi:hypothetical protein